MTKEELMNAITGLPAKTQVYKIDDYADLDHSDGCPLLGVIVVNEPDSEPVIYLRKKMKAERIQQFKKAFTLYRRGGYSLTYRWKLYFIRDIQKKKLPNNFKKIRKELEL